MDIEGEFRPPKCKVCGEEFPCREPYLIHMRTHEDPSTRCPHCNKTRDEAQPDENQCQCPYYDMMPVEDEDHSGREKKYECEVCGDRFYTEDGLSRHISQRKIEKVCTCIHCGEVYCYVQRFIVHLAEAHNIKSKSQ
uniref:C2H2-type domain-containing protein n=1 Tax=Bracon brevicornis TaxID=1563983 RepID=A0A6V7J4W6_9HYME